MTTQKHSPDTEGQPARCLARSIGDTLVGEPQLEAVTISSEGPEISIATLGRTDSNQLEQRVADSMADSRTVSADYDCALLRPSGDCSSCKIPLRAEEQQGFTVHRDGIKTTIARITCPTSPRFWIWRKLPRIVPRAIELPGEDDDLDEWKPQLATAIVCGIAVITGHLVPSASLALACFIVAYLSGAWFAVEEVVERLRERVVDIHFLMLAVATGSAAIGEWAEGAILLFLFSLSGALEHYAMGRTQKEIRSLFKSAPKTATQIADDDTESEIAVESIRAGTRLLIRPGDQFPVDAEVVQGESASDESNLTGESKPVDKRRGDSVMAGTMNLWGSVQVNALRAADESSLQKIIRLIRQAQKMKAPSQRFTDKFGSGYTYLIIGLALVMFFVWWLGFKLPAFTSTDEISSAFYRTMTFLVVASPCALVLSIPSAVLAAIAWGARRGILFRGGAAVEQLAETGIVALDKTGTLTTGELTVDRIESFPPGNEKLIEQIAFSLEKLSDHPLARAITQHGKRNEIASLKMSDFKSLTGMGIRARMDNRTVVLGRRTLIEEVHSSIACPEQESDEPGMSEVWVSDGESVGRITLRDEIRPLAASVIEQLRKEGLRTLVLTGDKKSTAERLRKEVSVDEIRAELSPEQKLETIRMLTAAGERVTMVGDGVNDAPSLAAAHVGIAMGSRGSDAALEQASVVLMYDRLENVLAAFRLSRRARAIIRQNLVISLGTVVVLAVLALGGAIPLSVGVLGHEGSTVIVVLNSLRLLFGRN